jgi:DNA-binding transcriptional ArsR family regulator
VGNLPTWLVLSVKLLVLKARFGAWSVASYDGLEMLARCWRLSFQSGPVEPFSLSVESVADEDAFQSESCADQLKALSEPIRLRIIDVLRHGAMTVGDIAEFLETELVTVSHHLKILKHAELVEVKRDGRFMVYSLRHDLLQKAGGGARQYLNLGCCRIEVPNKKPDAE